MTVKLEDLPPQTTVSEILSLFSGSFFLFLSFSSLFFLLFSLILSLFLFSFSFLLFSSHSLLPLLIGIDLSENSISFLPPSSFSSPSLSCFVRFQNEYDAERGKERDSTYLIGKREEEKRIVFIAESRVREIFLFWMDSLSSSSSSLESSLSLLDPLSPPLFLSENLLHYLEMKGIEELFPIDLREEAGFIFFFRKEKEKGKREKERERETDFEENI